MQGLEKERWVQLCEQAAIEQDPLKLLALISELNRLLEVKEQRLGNFKDSSLTPLPRKESA